MQIESPQAAGPIFFLAMLDIQPWALEFYEAAHMGLELPVDGSWNIF